MGERNREELAKRVFVSLNRFCLSQNKGTIEVSNRLGGQYL